jgi:hypothetical protein
MLLKGLITYLSSRKITEILKELARQIDQLLNVLLAIFYEYFLV